MAPDCRQEATAKGIWREDRGYGKTKTHKAGEHEENFI